MPSFFIPNFSATARTLNTNEYGVVTAQGTLFTDNVTAITSTDDVQIENHGAIGTSRFKNTISLAGQGNSVLNTGSIMSERVAIDFTFNSTLNAFGNSNIVNTGTITSILNRAITFGQHAVSLQNSGQIFADDQAVFVRPPVEGGGAVANNFFMNSGVISSAKAEALLALVGRNTLLNSGEMHCGVRFVSAPGEFDSTGPDDTIRNSGFIDGDVFLGDYDDLLETLREGMVTGTVHGEAGEDTLIGGRWEDALSGGTENDLVRGADGEDTLSGDDGADTVRGGGDDDEIDGGTGNDLLLGDEGADTIIGGDGADTLRGGAGDDSLNGGFQDDELHGWGGDDILDGGRGNDLLRGGKGDDSLQGGQWADTLEGGAGDDFMNGGKGADMFVMKRGWGTDEIADFVEGQDVIDLTHFGFFSYDDFRNETFERRMPDAVELQFASGEVLIVNGLTLSQLSDDDFMF